MKLHSLLIITTKSNKLYDTSSNLPHRVGLVGLFLSYSHTEDGYKNFMDV